MAHIKRNKWNPMGLRRNHRGQLLDKYGRVMQTDWDEFDSRRMNRPDDYPKWPKVINPLHAATHPTGQLEALVLATKLLESEGDARSFIHKLGRSLPRQFTVTSCTGKWLANSKGDVLFRTFDPGMERDDPALAAKRIKRFDIDEYLRYWNQFSRDIDICDIGYWTNDGSYTPAEEQYRREERVRRGLGEAADPRTFLRQLGRRIPGKFMVISYMGEWLANPSGRVTFQTFYPGMERDDRELADVFRHITDFDIQEYIHYWGNFDKEIDICDIGYWTNDGSYTPAEEQYRREERVRRGLGEAAGEPPAEPAPEPSSPRQFLKKIGKPKYTFNVDIYDWDSLSDWHRAAFYEMVHLLEADWEQDPDTGLWNTDLELEAYDNTSMRVAYGRQDWTVYESEGAARNAAVERAIDAIDEGVFSQDFLQGYIDTDRLKRDLRSDVEESIRREFDDQYSDDESKRDFFLKKGDLEQEDCYGTETDEDGDEIEVELPVEDELLSKIENLTELHIESEVESRLEDPVAYLQEIFGDEDGLKQAMEIGGIDSHAAANDAVDADGVAHFLSTYDDNQTDLDSGAVAFRHN